MQQGEFSYIFKFYEFIMSASFFCFANFLHSGFISIFSPTKLIVLDKVTSVARFSVCAQKH